MRIEITEQNLLDLDDKHTPDRDNGTGYTTGPWCVRIDRIYGSSVDVSYDHASLVDALADLDGRDNAYLTFSGYWHEYVPQTNGWHDPVHVSGAAVVMVDRDKLIVLAKTIKDKYDSAARAEREREENEWLDKHVYYCA